MVPANAIPDDIVDENPGRERVLYVALTRARKKLHVSLAMTRAQFGEVSAALPSRFLQEIEYDAPESMEMNRQQLASDPRVQTYLMAWRSMFPGGVEIEVFKVI